MRDRALSVWHPRCHELAQISNLSSQHFGRPWECSSSWKWIFFGGGEGCMNGILKLCINIQKWEESSEAIKVQSSISLQRGQNYIAGTFSLLRYSRVYKCHADDGLCLMWPRYLELGTCRVLNESFLEYCACSQLMSSWLFLFLLFTLFLSVCPCVWGTVNRDQGTMSGSSFSLSTMWLPRIRLVRPPC